MSLRNASTNVAVNDTLYTLNKGRFEVGKIGENDLLKSELALLRARAAVDDAQARARSRRGGAAPRRSRIPTDSALTIVTPDSIPIVDADPDVAVTEALQELEHRSQQNELDDVQTRCGISAREVEQPVQRDRRGERRASTRPRRRSARRIRARSASRR